MTVATKPATAGRDLLQRALRDTALGPRARDVFVAYPAARELFHRMAWYVTDQPLHPAGRPLLHVAVMNAFRCLDTAEKNRQSSREERLTALYAGLFRPLPALNEVYVESGEETWDPLRGEPLGEWLASHVSATVRLGTPADELAEKTPIAFRAAVATHIFQASDVADIDGRLDRVLDYPYG